MELTRRQSTADREETWHIYYGDIRVRSIPGSSSTTKTKFRSGTAIAPQGSETPMVFTSVENRRDQYKAKWSGRFKIQLVAHPCQFSITAVLSVLHANPNRWRRLVVRS